MGISPGKLYNDNLWKLSNEYGDVSVMYAEFSRQDHPARDVTRVSVVPRKVTVKIGDAENR